MPSIQGRLVTQATDDAAGRTVTVSIPPVAAEAIVFATDGQRLARWGVDLESTDSVPTMVVGVHGAEDEAGRLQEYVLGESTPEFQFDPGRFAALEHYFVDFLPNWVAERFDLELSGARTGVVGVSAGAEFALAMGIRHPHRFSAVFAASPGGGYRPPASMPSVLPRAYLLAGDQEPFFRENAERWSDALVQGGGDVRMQRRPGSHGGPFWRAEFPRMVEWAFRRR